VPPLATEPSRQLLHLFGTVCRSRYAHRRHCKFFAADWRPSFCPVVQLLWLRASHCTDYHVTSLLFLRVTCPCSLRTYATLKFIRSSSSSSWVSLLLMSILLLAWWCIWHAVIGDHRTSWRPSTAGSRRLSSWRHEVARCRRSQSTRASWTRRRLQLRQNAGSRLKP